MKGVAVVIAVGDEVGFDNGSHDGQMTDVGEIVSRAEGTALGKGEGGLNMGSQTFTFIQVYNVGSPGHIV